MRAPHTSHACAKYRRILGKCTFVLGALQKVSRDLLCVKFVMLSLYYIRVLVIIINKNMRSCIILRSIHFTSFFGVSWAHGQRRADRRRRRSTGESYPIAKSGTMWRAVCARDACDMLVHKVSSLVCSDHLKDSFKGTGQPWCDKTSHHNCP